MKVFLITALALVTSSFAAPAPDKSPAKRESHLSTLNIDGTPSTKVFLDALGGGGKDEQKATTNVKVKRTKATPKKKTPKKSSSKPSVKSSTKNKKKPKTSHSRRLLLSSSTRFKNGQDLIDSLDSLDAQIVAHGDKINATLLQVQSGDQTAKSGTADVLKEIAQIRAAVSGALTRLSTTKNLKLTTDQRADVADLLEDLVRDILGIVNDLLETLGVRLNLTTSLNPLMNMLSNFLGGLAATDSKLAPELRDRLEDIIKGQINSDGTGGFDALGSGIENPLLRLHGSLKTSTKSN